MPQTPIREDSFPEQEQQQGGATPESRQRSRSNRSRSNSALGAPTVMAGLIAAGVAAGWQPNSRQSVDEREEDGEGQDRGEEREGRKTE